MGLNGPPTSPPRPARASQPAPPAPRGPQSAQPVPPNPMRSTRLWVTLALVLLANIFITNVLFAPAQPTTVTLSYDAFNEPLPEDTVVSVTPTGDSIPGVTKTPVKEAGTGTAA